MKKALSTAAVLGMLAFSLASIFVIAVVRLSRLTPEVAEAKPAVDELQVRSVYQSNGQGDASSIQPNTVSIRIDRALVVVEHLKDSTFQVKLVTAMFVPDSLTVEVAGTSFEGSAWTRLKSDDWLSIEAGLTLSNHWGIHVRVNSAGGKSKLCIARASRAAKSAGILAECDG